MSNSGGIARFRWSGSGFCAPSLARASLCSFPLSPLWPLTHLKWVVVVRCFSKCAAFLKKFAFFILIQPASSHQLRCVVSPSMTYFESVTIMCGTKWGTVWMAAIVATSSPIWLECWVPGVHRALFPWLLSSNHIPPPLWVFCLPLL